MAGLKTITPLLTPEEKVAGVAAEPGTWRLAAIMADIATLGTGTLLAGVFNVALVFIVPRLVTVEDYGYWRMFILYAGYVGLLHFGFADGALLRWAGRSLEEFHGELWPALKYLFWQHLALLLPACLVVMIFLKGPLRFVAICIMVYAMLFNGTTTVQYSLQSARDFRPVAISAIAAPSLFCVLMLLCAVVWHLTFKEVTTLFLVGWCVPLAFLLLWTKPWAALQVGIAAKQLAKDCLRNGWPIVMTNIGVGLIVAADRLAVSWAASIQDFAQYSLAASAMAVPLAVVATCSKVCFPHLAGLKQDRRRRIYGLSSWLLLVAWTISLPYYFALDVFVRHVLPKYVPSLQYARILLLAVPFVAVIQILQMSYAYLNGIQKKFLGQTVSVLAVSIGLTAFAAFHGRSLGVVAGAQVAVLGVWWLCNEWTLRWLTGQEGGDLAEFSAVYVMVAVSYWLASSSGVSPIGSTALYYLAAFTILGLMCREKLTRLLSSLRATHAALTES